MLVSSAKIRNESLLDDFGRSFIYNKNSRGPRVEPWGTPQVIGLREDSTSPVFTKLVSAC